MCFTNLFTQIANIRRVGAGHLKLAPPEGCGLDTAWESTGLWSIHGDYSQMLRITYKLDLISPQALPLTRILFRDFRIMSSIGLIVF